jgi:hypothetical protein
MVLLLGIGGMLKCVLPIVSGDAPLATGADGSDDSRAGGRFAGSSDDDRKKFRQ